MSEPAKPTLKTCPRCGKEFECLHAPGCWCFNYTIPPENLEKLKQKYDNCLCPECLKDYTTSPPISPRNEAMNYFK